MRIVGTMTQGRAVIEATKEEAIARQSIAPAWMSNLKEGTHLFLVLNTPFGNYWLNEVDEIDLAILNGGK